MSDLAPRDFITLNLDYRQNGLGSNSCGPAQSPENTVKPEAFRFRILLQAYMAEDSSPERLSHRMSTEAKQYEMEEDQHA
jgi:beta-galactosidase/evolved beta-galactosidase subunit alpha